MTTSSTQVLKYNKNHTHKLNLTINSKGSTHVGRIVGEAANKHLTPCTLELGGKCPVYLDDSVDLKVATKRILWGKMANLGQTCVAPDYILCSPDMRDRFVQEAKEVYTEFYSWDKGKGEVALISHIPVLYYP